MVEQARPQQLNNNFPLPAGNPPASASLIPTGNSKLETRNSSVSLSPTRNSKLETRNSSVLPLPTRNSKLETRNWKVIAAIPCFNTECTIASVVAKTKKYVDEVIVIDDGSTDMTVKVAKNAGAVVISHKRNMGKGAAMKTAAANIDADIIVFIDGDGQHDPGDIPKLLEPILRGEADFVIGSRYLSDSNRSNNPFLRKATNAAASFVISFVISAMQPMARFISCQPLPKKNPVKTHNSNYRLLNGKIKWITDCTSGFTAMRKDNCSTLNLISNGFQIETEMIFEQAKNGFIIAESPISCVWGESGSKLSIAKDGIKTMSLLLGKLLHYSTAKGQSTIKSDIAVKERGIP